MAKSIINSQGRSVLHIDSTDGAITLAELKATNEATVVSADIVEMFWQTATSIKIDRGGTDVHLFTGTGHWNLGQSGAVLSGTNTADLGITVSGDSYAVIVVHKQYSGG